MFLFCKPNMNLCKDFSYQLINSIKHKPMKDIIISNIYYKTDTYTCTKQTITFPYTK